MLPVSMRWLGWWSFSSPWLVYVVRVKQQSRGREEDEEYEQEFINFRRNRTMTRIIKHLRFDEQVD